MWLLGKLALTRQIFVGKVISLHFNTQSRFDIAFLPRSKCLWISWLQSPSSVWAWPRKYQCFRSLLWIVEAPVHGIRSQKYFSPSEVLRWRLETTPPFCGEGLPPLTPCESLVPKKGAPSLHTNQESSLWEAHGGSKGNLQGGRRRHHFAVFAADSWPITVRQKHIPPQKASVTLTMCTEARLTPCFVK